MQEHDKQPVTKTESTKGQYRAHFFRLERRTRTSLHLTPDAAVMPQQIAATFIDSEPDWSEATARAYRAALVFVFDEVGDGDSMEAKDMIYHVNDDGEWQLQIRERVKAERKRRKRSSPRTSAQKAKKMSQEDLILLRNEFARSWSKWAKQTETWFFAGILTGLRPTEWQVAELATDKLGNKMLMVKNAKNTNGRAHSATRTIRLGKMPQANIDLIASQILSAQTYVKLDKFDHFYFQCRRLLCKVSDRLWPRRIKHPTLYTARHLFSADAKTKFDRIGVAALMGHASTDTAYNHYGKRHTGTGGMSVSPDEADIAAVTARNPDYVAEVAGIAKKKVFPDFLKPSAREIS
jgi:hypothetical protein